MNRIEYVEQILGDRLQQDAKAEASAFAPANIALCKYWGKRDVELNLPVTDSLSISLGGLGATTTLRAADRDRAILNGEEQATDSSFFKRAFQFIDLFRPDGLNLELVTESTIPVAAGLASSASGFAALLLALNNLFHWKASVRECSLLARLGSGSACRSIEPGFVHWHAGNQPDGMDSYAERLDADWPELRMGLLVLEAGPKSIGSREAMNRTTNTSELYQSWPAQVTYDLEEIRLGIFERDFQRLGEVAEQNALAMHATMIASRPPVVYWTGETVALIHRVHDLRRNGLGVYLTMDAGPNVKLIYLSSNRSDIQAAFPERIEVDPFDSPISQ